MSLRVLLVSGIFPPDIGGPATYIPIVAAALMKRGHFPRVVALADDVHSPTPFDFPVMRVQRAPAMQRRVRLVRLLMSAARTSDVILGNGLLLEIALVNTVLRRPWIQKVVGDWAWERAIARGWTRESFEEFQSGNGRWQTQALRRLRSTCIRRADQVVVPSRYLADRVAAWGMPKAQIRVIYNAVERPDSVPTPDAPMTRSLKLAFVGRLVPWKHVDQILHALGEIPEVELVVIGEGSELGPLQALASRLGVANRVRWTGAKSREETVSYMRACDIFVLNSSYEGFPHVVLEAMDAGLAVVATRVGGTPEIVIDGVNGALIPPFDRAALIRKLKELVADEALRSKLAHGGMTTARRFTVDRMLDETESALRDVVRRRTAP